VKVQFLIDEMHRGNTEIICKGIESDNPLLCLNAIMAGARQGVKEKRYLEALKVAKGSKDRVLGFSVHNFSVAALHLLGAECYEGDDEDILALIQFGFKV